MDVPGKRQCRHPTRHVCGTPQGTHLTRRKVQNAGVVFLGRGAKQLPRQQGPVFEHLQAGPGLAGRGPGGSLAGRRVENTPPPGEALPPWTIGVRHLALLVARLASGHSAVAPVAPQQSGCRSLRPRRESTDHPKADPIAPFSGIVRPAEGGPTEPGLVGKVATTGNADASNPILVREPGEPVGGVVGCTLVLAPFSDVAVHVVQAEGIGRVRPDRGRPTQRAASNHAVIRAAVDVGLFGGQRSARVEGVVVPARQAYSHSASVGSR